MTIPKGLRERFGLRPQSDVEFHVVGDELVLRKKARPLNLHKWRGYCRDTPDALGAKGADDYIEDVRGR